MKTQIKTIIATSFAALTLTVSSLSANASVKHPTTETTQVKTFKKVSVSGNVEVTFIQSNKEGVSYADNNFGTAKVMQQGDELSITSANNGTARLVVYVKDIYRIQGNDNAVIKTDGKLAVNNLQVFLKGNAKANINTSTSSLYTILNDNSSLTLSGDTKNHTLASSKNSSLSMAHFAAQNTDLEAQMTLSNSDNFAATK
ncbi:hypothetical protein ABIB40_001070 [Pedobacter sp. UYP30]|uniref:GIN domain-containing protein n=1 Tax=Pedobacter sp. UYP30 TaxID=1756400 RepID=UPI003396F6A9